MAIQRKALKEFFQENESVPIKPKQVARALGVKGEDYKLLKRVLKEMSEEGVLHRVRNNAYVAGGGAAETLSGKLDLVRRNYGFVVPDVGGRDIFVKNYNLGDAFDGDRVEVKIINRPAEGSPEGVIVRVNERGLRRFIGTFYKQGRMQTVVPRDDRLVKEIIIPNVEAKAVKDGDRVVVEIFDWGGPGGKARGRVVKSLMGPKVGPDDEILIKYDFPQRFPAVVLTQSRDIPDHVLEADLAGREDLRGITTFTIDPASAEDFDDAVSAEPLPDGETRVGVHIADVSHYVTHGSRLDREAFQRAMSVYLTAAYIPMLPTRLSSGVCSLVEAKDRLTFSVLMRIGADGVVRESRPCLSVIRSAKRMNYEQAQTLLEGGAPEGDGFEAVREPLRRLGELTEIRRGIRVKRGYIDLELPEPEVIRDSSGVPVDIRPKPRLLSHRLIEEFMVTANEAVAVTLEQSGLPSIYRVHGEPAVDAIDNMQYGLSTLAHQLDIPKHLWPVNPAVLTGILERASAQGLGDIVSYIILRSMKRALYSTNNIGHFGLASDSYTHFTSPIRRYPDLCVHRLLKLHLDSQPPAPKVLESLESELAEVCLHSSHQEEQISSAERESDDRVRAEFMQRFIGQKFEARVTSVKPFGMGIKLKRYYVEGFVHISDMDDDYYELDEKKAILRGKNKHRTFQVGQEIEVLLSRSDPSLLRIEFILVGGDAEAPEGVETEREKPRKEKDGERKGHRHGHRHGR
ncbi:ribonuclease R [bacterium]|nr:ribonuclease R [bacterium]